MAVRTIEGRILSGHNQCMVALQCPSATIVGGFQQWKAAGRIVRKGEHGIGIWIPRFGKEGDLDTRQEPESFIFGTVFDVSQTEALGQQGRAA